MKKILVLIALVIVILTSMKEDTLTIPYDAIRFRVIAESNTLEDQTKKNNISKSIEEYVYNLTASATSSDDVKSILLSNKDKIESYINKDLNTNATVSIGKNYFDKKSYKGIKYDSGYYDSIVVTLGSGQGVNWWCVIYPPLCLIKEDTEEVEYTTLVNELLNNYNI